MMLMYFFKIMLVSLFCTIIIELTLAYILKVKNKKDLLNVLLVNILTNPLLVSLTLFINIRFGLGVRNILIYPMEILVVLVEGFIYKKYLTYKKINPYVLALILNIASYGLGEILNRIIY